MQILMARNKTNVQLKTKTMKKIVFYCQLLLMAAGSFSTQAQTNALCNDFLYNLRPESSDSVMYVKIAVTRFRPSTGTGVWDHVTASDVNAIISLANQRFSSVTPPTVPISGIPFISNTRIQLVLANGNSFFDVVDDSAYKSGAFAYQYYKIDHVVNLYLCWQSTGDSKGTEMVPGKYITFSQSVPGTDFPAGENGLAHEIGHYFGLTHATTAGPTDDGWPVIHFNYGSNCACDKAAASDFVEWNWTTGFKNCDDSVPPPNNLMSQNLGCFSYISPLQMAVMRYYMLTSYRDHLTSASYLEATEVNPARNQTITGGGTTTWSTPHYIPGNLTIAAGNTLKVQCLVAMTHNAKIIIEKGAKLQLDGGTITNISGRLWGGIDVKGDPNLAQVPANNGVLEVYHGTISNAYTAVRNYGYDSSGNVDYNSTGGIIMAYNSSFINNVRDIEFLATPMTIPSASRFEACDFITNDYIKDNNTVTAPYVHVSLWSINGVRFKGCHFENAAQAQYPYVGEGIHSIDAIYTVENWYSVYNQFIGFSKAISAINTNAQRPLNIYDATFYDNKQGIVLANMESANIDNNQFTMKAQGSMGVSLNNNKYYRVSNNLFTGYSNANSWKAGVYVSSSGDGAHRIYRNNFSNLYLGVAPQFNNSGINNTTDGLYMNCNDFTGSPNSYDIAMMGNNSTAANLMPTVAKYQGVYNASNFDAKALVRNQYGASCTSNGMKSWYVDITATKGIEHAANSQAVTRPEPQPDCSSSLLNIVNSGQSFNYSSHCLAAGNRPPSDPECPCAKCCLYNDISNGLSLSLNDVATLQSNYDNTIDGGNSVTLLSNINSTGLTVTQKKNLLTPLSPYLSDEVLIAFIQLSAVTGGDIIQIHDLNKPVSETVWSAIVGKGLSAGDMETLTNQQGDSPISERSVLQGELNIAKANLQFMYSEKLNYFLSDTLEHAQDTVIKLLSENLGGLPDASVQLINAYANARQYDNAFTQVSTLSSDPDYTELMTLYHTLLVLDTSRNKLMRALTDNTLKAILDDYADDSTKAGSPLARAALNAINGRSMNFQYLLPPAPSERLIRNTSEDESSTKDEISGTQFKIYPNPSQNSLFLNYVLPASADGTSEEFYMYSLKDLLGKEILKGQMKSNTTLEVNTGSLKNGIYFVSLVQGDKVLRNEKIVIMK